MIRAPFYGRLRRCYRPPRAHPIHSRSAVRGAPCTFWHSKKPTLTAETESSRQEDENERYWTTYLPAFCGSYWLDRVVTCVCYCTLCLRTLIGLTCMHMEPTAILMRLTTRIGSYNSLSIKTVRIGGGTYHVVVSRGHLI